MRLYSINPVSSFMYVYRGRFIYDSFIYTVYSGVPSTNCSFLSSCSAYFDVNTCKHSSIASIYQSAYRSSNGRLINNYVITHGVRNDTSAMPMYY